MDGSENPTAFVSHSLTEVEHKYSQIKKFEHKYSQIKKEALACIFGVTSFHNYLIAKCFTLQMDHKALLSLFNEHKEVPSQASGWNQR